MSSSRRLVYVTALVAGALTVLIVVAPFMRFAYRNFAAHVALDSVEAVIAAVAAYLAFGRYREREETGDLMLACALGLLSITNLVFSVVPLVVVGSRSTLFSLWGGLALRILATGALALAAFSRGRVQDKRRTGLIAGLALIGLPVVVAVVLGTVGDLPADVGAPLEPELSTRPHFQLRPGVLVPQSILLALFVGAAVGAVRRAERDGDELWGWISAASCLGAFARINYLLYPSIYTQWAYSGDFFRLGFYLFLLIGGVREINRYWAQVGEAAAAEERRRVARDFHDGLAQDAELSNVAGAAERALAEARQAVSALAAEHGIVDRAAFEQAAQDVEARTGVRIRLALSPIEGISAPVRQHLLRIMQEAMTNAALHSGAGEIEVALSDNGDTLLRVSDGGRGFDPGAISGGFGLTSMRERAETIGGQLRIESLPQRGTTVEVRIPSRV